MRRYLLVPTLVLVTLGSGCKTKASFQPNELTEAQKCLEPWLAGLDLIIAKDPGNEEVKLYRDTLLNCAVGKPIAHDGKMAMQVLSTPSNSKKAWVVVIPVCSELNLPTVWQEKLSKSIFIAEYNDELRTVIVRGNFQAPPLLRGLMLIHEMRHNLQASNPLTTEDVPEYRQFREVDAYEFEFGILDRLNLPTYESFLADEIARIRSDLANKGHAEPNTQDSRLEKIFPGLAKEGVSRNTAASEILIRAVFRIYDLESSEKIALQRKMNFMLSLGYR